MFTPCAHIQIVKFLVSQILVCLQFPKHVEIPQHEKSMGKHKNLPAMRFLYLSQEAESHAIPAT